MKIAFVSYEYPPESAYGGIATYVQQAARMLSARGHHVEVFSSSPLGPSVTTDDNITVHRVYGEDRTGFGNQIAPVFQTRHQEIHFDVLEGPEYYADADGIIGLVPDIPLVVKLHSPSYILWKLTFGHNWKEYVRGTIAAFKRNEVPYWHSYSGVERLHAVKADVIAIPSVAIGNKVGRDWKLEVDRILHVPNPYNPSLAMLNVPVETVSNTVVFLGRLTHGKGIINFIKAIPLVLKEHPTAQFRVVGRSTQWNGNDMRDYLRQLLRDCASSVEFADAVPLDEVPSVMASGGIFVIPSLWETFPNVCLEAMAAGRGIVASEVGGMVEMLEYGHAGILVSPHQPRDIASAVVKLLQNPALRFQLGHAARERVLTEYNVERVGPIQEACYEQAIRRRHAAGERKFRSKAK